MIELAAWLAAAVLTALANVATQKITRPTWAAATLWTLQIVAMSGLLLNSFNTNNTAINLIMIGIAFILAVGTYYGRPTK